MAVSGLRFCVRAFSSCGKWGPLLIAVHGPLTIAVSLVAEHGLQTRRLSSCGSRAQPLRGTWDPPRPGLEPMSPALADRLSTTEPPGKPSFLVSFAALLVQDFLILCAMLENGLGFCYYTRQDLSLSPLWGIDITSTNHTLLLYIVRTMTETI